MLRYYGWHRKWLRDQCIRVDIQLCVIIFLFILWDVMGKFDWKGRIYYLVHCCTHLIVLAKLVQNSGFEQSPWVPLIIKRLLVWNEICTSHYFVVMFLIDFLEVHLKGIIMWQKISTLTPPNIKGVVHQVPADNIYLQ